MVRNERTRDDDTQSEFREESRHAKFLEMTGVEKRKGKSLGCW